MKVVSYSLVMDGLMYAQLCTLPDITFVVGVWGKYLSNPSHSH